MACTSPPRLQAFIYLAGLQLCLSGGTRSMLAGAAGLLAGLVYRSNVFGVRSARVRRRAGQHGMQHEVWQRRGCGVAAVLSGHTAASVGQAALALVPASLPR